MALDPEEFYEHAVAAADNERRLPLSRMTGWDVSPFEQDGLRVASLRPPVLPEPARHGEDPSQCQSCRNRDDGIWFDASWRLNRITGVGVPLVLMLYPRDHYDLEHLPDERACELGRLTTQLARHVHAYFQQPGATTALVLGCGRLRAPGRAVDGRSGGTSVVR